MTDYGKVTAQVRSSHGKGDSRRLRARGLIPAVLYGKGQPSVALALDPRALQRGMDPRRRYNTMFTLTIEETGKAARTETAILADWDVDPLGAGLRHVDLLRVEPSAEIEREIPVTYVGRAVGTSTGGRLKTFQRTVRVRAPAASVPPELTVDVTPLDGGQYLRVKDVPLPGGRVVGSPELPLACVETAKAEEAPAADAKPKK